MGEFFDARTDAPFMQMSEARRITDFSAEAFNQIFKPESSSIYSGYKLTEKYRSWSFKNENTLEVFKE